MRIAFAWELGENLGYLARQIPIAERLREAGHEVSFVLRDANLACELLAPRGFRYARCPQLHQSVRPGHRSINYSDVLYSCGYGNPAALHASITEWLRLWQEIKPDVIVIEERRKGTDLFS